MQDRIRDALVAHKWHLLAIAVLAQWAFLISLLAKGMKL